MWRLSYWAVPIFSSIVWLAMLITMIVSWSLDGYPHYSSMDPKQTIAYISDVGAQRLKPLFIAMSAVTIVTFDIAFVLERWLRHTGRLTRNTSWFQRFCSIASIIAAIAGGAGLVLLAIFDTLRHPRAHNSFLALFLVGYIVSAIFICWEYQRLGIHFRETSVLRFSFWIKLFFILIEVALAIAFGVTQRKDQYNTAAIIEWVIAFIFFFYVLSFFIDFMPVVRHKGQSYTTEMDMADAEAADTHHGGGREYRHANGYGNGNGYSNGVNGHSNDYFSQGNGMNGAVKPVQPAYVR